MVKITPFFCQVFLLFAFEGFNGASGRCDPRTCNNGFECFRHRCRLSWRGDDDVDRRCNPSNCEHPYYKCVKHRGGGGVFRCACDPSSCSGHRQCLRNRCVHVETPPRTTTTTTTTPALPPPLLLHDCGEGCPRHYFCLDKRCLCNPETCKGEKRCLHNQCVDRDSSEEERVSSEEDDDFRQPPSGPLSAFDNGCGGMCPIGNVCVFGVCAPAAVGLDPCDFIQCLPGHGCFSGLCRPFVLHPRVGITSIYDYYEYPLYP